MKILRVSPYSRKVHVMDLPVTHAQLAAWRNGELIQNALPHLTADEREFIKTGITPEEWKELYGEEE